MNKFEDYSNIEKILESIQIPEMFKIRQHFSNDKIEDIAVETRNHLDKANVGALVKKGMSVAITGSSRGIKNMNIVLKEIVTFLKENGAIPFIIPAMGSHGGATDKGQREILEGYGITEEFCGCEIRSSMETVFLGHVREDGKDLPVYVDKYAYEADAIVAVGRIKPHSAFKGEIESGILKMLCVGIGNQKGADIIHKEGFGRFKTRIPLFGNFVRTHTNVIFGVGIIENAFDETHKVVVLHNEEIPEEEPKLLEYAKSLMPKIFIDKTDVLVVKEIGKNFSGSGMDPNITGTWATPYGYGGIQKQKTCVLDLTDESHGNGLGIGMADTTTLKFYNKMDFLATYPNALTATYFMPIKLAMVLKNDEMAIKGAIKTINEGDPENPKVVLIRNTLSIEEIYLSKAFYEEVKDIKDIEILTKCEPLEFDENGDLKIWSNKRHSAN